MRVAAIGVFLFLFLPTVAYAQDATQAVLDRQHALQVALDGIEREIATEQAVLDAAQAKHQSLQNQIGILDAEIKKTELQIKAINLTIEQLKSNIGVRNRTLATLAGALAAEKESLAQILRQTEMLDAASVVDVALSSKSVSRFFADLDAFASIKTALAASFTAIRETSTATENEKAALEMRLAEQHDLQTEAQLAKRQVLAQEQEKQQLLRATKGQEAAYQKLISANQKTAAQIRSELFVLAGGAGQIPLPAAITLAQQAGKATGVRPALILGVLKQETDLGANVGQCLLTNSPRKGDGKTKKTGATVLNVMKPDRDVDPFITLTAALGFDAFSMPVSCPPGYGYGGAMGPAQFIPSTWTLYQGRIVKLAGHVLTNANPWDNLDAFTATALYLSDLGASALTASAERTAALRYFAGANYRKPGYAFYGDSVMQFAANFEQEIGILNGA